MKKLKSVRKEIQGWNIIVRRRFEANIKKLEDDLFACDQDAFSSHRNDLERRLKDEYQTRESITKQKSRMNWTHEGDLNTKYFHAQVKKGNHVNQIFGIWIDETWTCDPSQVKEAFASHLNKDSKNKIIPEGFALDHYLYYKSQQIKQIILNSVSPMKKSE